MTSVRLLTLLLLAALAAPARAQNSEFPSRTVTLVVPSAPGSATDIVARVMADRFEAKWKQSVIVLNVAGGGLNIGAQRVAAANPDGYTLLVAPPPPITINDLVYKNLPYDPGKFEPIAVLTTVPNALVVRTGLPVATVADFVALAKQQPDKLSYGSQGLGSTAHLAAKLFEKLADVRLVHVPYRGEAPILNDLTGQHIDAFFAALSNPLALFKEGKIKILAVGSAERSAFLPEVPTLREAGLKGFESTTWYALVAPPETPKALTTKINADVRSILSNSQVSERFKQINLEPAAGSIDETIEFFENDRAVWRKVIGEAGIQPQ